MCLVMRNIQLSNDDFLVFQYSSCALVGNRHPDFIQMCAVCTLKGCVVSVVRCMLSVVRCMYSQGLCRICCALYLLTKVVSYLL